MSYCEHQPTAALYTILAEPINAGLERSHRAREKATWLYERAVPSPTGTDRGLHDAGDGSNPASRHTSVPQWIHA